MGERARGLNGLADRNPIKRKSPRGTIHREGTPSRSPSDTTSGLTSNSRIHMPELASLSMNILRDCLSYIESAHRVLILDACRNDPHKGMGDEDNLLTADFSRDVIAKCKDT